MVRRWQYWGAALMAAAGSAALIYQWYWTRPLWLDEEMIALNLRDRTVAELAGPLWMNQAAPLGWLALQRLILLEFGSGERTLRALPVLFGIATLALTLWAGRRWMGPLGAAIFTLVCSFGVFISFFPLETKHYSADVFFGLLLPVLAVWAIEPREDVRRLRRVFIWWLTAAVAQWFANGALFAVPACASVLFGITAQRAGMRKALLVALPGLICAGSFAVHYWLSTRYALHSEYLQDYWSGTLPPDGAGFGGMLGWTRRQITSLAGNPGGTHLGILFWLAAGCGIGAAIQRRAPVGLVLLCLPLSGFLLAALRLVPMEGRLSLWMTPALYAAIAIAAEEAIQSSRRFFAERHWTRAAAASVIAAIALTVSADIFRVGRYELAVRPRSNHGLDDRGAVRFLLNQRRPGDVFVATHLGLPAVWWYGGIKVSPPNLGRTYEQDGAAILEVRHHAPGPECVGGDSASALDGRTRVSLYLGFDSRTPEGFQELVLDALSTRGRLTSYRRIAEEGVAAVFDLTQPPGSWTVLVTRPGGTPLNDVPRPPGCAGFYPASRW